MRNRRDFRAYNPSPAGDDVTWWLSQQMPLPYWSFYSIQGQCHRSQHPCWAQLGRPDLCIHLILYVTYSGQKEPSDLPKAIPTWQQSWTQCFLYAAQIHKLDFVFRWENLCFQKFLTQKLLLNSGFFPKKYMYILGEIHLHDIWMQTEHIYG